MDRTRDVPLILGGHSFISQLGNDPPTSEAEQRRIVEACLDHGILWLDTTYKPERTALGKALHVLGRRSEAKILAWNFFTDFSAGDPVGGPAYYRPRHIDSILEELGSTYVDALVFVPLDDPEENHRQQELAIEWHGAGDRRGHDADAGDSLQRDRPAMGRAGEGRAPSVLAPGEEIARHQRLLQQQPFERLQHMAVIGRAIVRIARGLRSPDRGTQLLRPFGCGKSAGLDQRHGEGEGFGLPEFAELGWFRLAQDSSPTDRERPCRSPPPARPTARAP